MKLFLLLYARSNFNILISHTCDKDANSNYLNQLTSLHNCLPAKNWWYTEEAPWPYAKPEGWLRRKTLGWNIWERTVLLRWSTSLHWDSLPGGTRPRLWCRETADDNRLLTCFLDHTVPSDDSKREVFYSWGIFQRVGKMLKNDCNAIHIVKKQK